MLNQCKSYSLINTLSVLILSLFILLCTMPEVSSCEFSTIRVFYLDKPELFYRVKTVKVLLIIMLVC